MQATCKARLQSCPGFAKTNPMEGQRQALVYGKADLRN